MRGIAIALAGMALLALPACEEDEAATNSRTAAATGEAEAALNCRRDLPDPPLTGAVKADFTLELANFGYEFVEGRHRYPHTRRFKETAGVPVTIYRGKVCVADGGECADACVGYRIDGDTMLVQADHHVATKRDKDRITIRYWARDDAGNFFELSRVIETDGQEATVVE